MEKYSKQLWYSHKAISQALHIPCIYNKEKKGRQKQRAVHASDKQDL